MPFRVEGANVIYGYLKDQPKSLQQSVRVVPVVVLYKDNKPVRQWVADISFKIKLSKEELIKQIKKEINKQKS